MFGCVHVRQAVVAGLALCVAAFASPAAAGVSVRSPDGRATATVSVDATGRLAWTVGWSGRSVLKPAPIVLRFRGEPAPAFRLGRVTRSRHDERVLGLIGKASSARDRYSEAVIEVEGGPRPIALVVRAYDDGVAYRWRFRTRGDFAIADENAGFGVPDDAQVWAAMADKDGFQSSYETYYRTGAPRRATDPGRLVLLPMLVRSRGAYVGITEAALHDWAGLYLTRRDGAPGFSSTLSPRLDRPGVAVLGGAGEHMSPWRVAMLGNAPGRLIESNLVTLLNPPADKRDWSWVKPGKTSFPWWNDYWWPGSRFTPGLNTATMQAYVDFDADHGVPYHTLDGYQGQAWYGGPIGPDGTPQDLTHAGPDIDMPELLAHARARGVRIRVWCHWKPLAAQLDAALDAWARWGVAGLMVDFMNRDDQQMIAFYDEVARKAADRHLTVVYHGAYKPTGTGRTWPNVLSYEAVRGTEYDKFPQTPDNPADPENLGSTAEHEAVTPFVRMLAGPMDIHEGGWAYTAPGRLVHRQTAPEVVGTRARALATYIVEENGSPMMADSPARYAADPAGLAFAARVPAAWDETRVLAGEVGRYVVVARRKGHDWWLGAVTDSHARELTVPLAMLGGGSWRLDGYSDDGETRRAQHETAVVRAGSLKLHLASAGGYAARLSPATQDRRASA